MTATTTIEIIGPADLVRYATIPMRFVVRTTLAVEPRNSGLGGLVFTETPVEPWVKDYDGDGHGPTDWPKVWDISNWGLFLAIRGDRPVGGAAVAYDTNGVNELEGRSDLAVLWDIRVHPDDRGSGVGRRLFDGALVFARERDCRQLKIETQNINVPACRFYQSLGCVLGAVNCHAYPDLPDEVRLDWYYDL